MTEVAPHAHHEYATREELRDAVQRLEGSIKRVLRLQGLTILLMLAGFALLAWRG